MFLNKSGETVVGTFKTRETAMKINEKVEAYWDSLKVSKWCKDYPYGKSLVEDEIIDSFDDWNRKKEYLKIADQELDYLWKLNNIEYHIINKETTLIECRKKDTNMWIKYYASSGYIMGFHNFRGIKTLIELLTTK